MLGPFQVQEEGRVVKHLPIQSVSASAVAPPEAPDKDRDPPSAIATLPRWSKELIVLIGLAMGVVVYGFVRAWWGPTSMTMWVLVAAILAMGSFTTMALVHWRDRLLWTCLVLVAALVLGLNASVWWLSGADVSPTTAWHWWQLELAVALFIALAWVQAVLQSRRLRSVRYSSLFAHAWHNTMALVLVAQFVGLCWLVLLLWAGLFSLVKVHLFTQGFTQPIFICLATGLMGGIGVVLARGQPRALQVQLQLVLALFRVLLPLLALVVVLFTLALPFTGIEPLWQTRKATLLLVVVQLCLVLCVNAVYQDGLQQVAPYPRPVTALIHAAMVLSPVLGGLAVWAVLLRVQQYGWTHDRIWALVVTVVVLLYGLGYAWRALQRQRFLWLQGLGRWNAAMSWLIVALLAVLHTPLLDVYRWSAHSQLQRLQQGEAPMELTQLQSLRFDHGRHGLSALQTLAADPKWGDTATQAVMQQVLHASKKTRLARTAKTPQAKRPLREVLELAQGHAAPPADWWQALEEGSLRHALSSCRSGTQETASACVLSQLPLSMGVGPVPVVCRMGKYSPTCSVFERDAQQAWQQVGQLSWGGVPKEHRPALAQAIREGRLVVQPSRWQAVVVPGLDLTEGQVR